LRGEKMEFGEISELDNSSEQRKEQRKINLKKMLEKPAFVPD